MEWEIKMNLFENVINVSALENLTLEQLDELNRILDKVK